MKARINEKGIEIVDADARIKNLTDVYNAEQTRLKCTDGVIKAINEKKTEDVTADDQLALANRKMLDEYYQPQIDEYKTGYKEYVEQEYNGSEKAGELDIIMPYFDETDTTIYRKMKLVKNDSQKVEQKIASIKAQLSESDYKVAKLYEAQLAGEEAPYDATEVISQRKAWRNEINELEQLLK